MSTPQKRRSENSIASPWRLDPADPAHPRWLIIGLAGITAHQVQSLVLEPRERPFRIAALVGLALMPLTTRLPDTARAIITTIPGLPAVVGAVIGHIVPAVRQERMPPATETAPLNLAGGAILLTIGAVILLRRIR